MAEREVRADRRMSDVEAMMWNIEKDPFLSSTFGSVTILDAVPDYDRFPGYGRSLSETTGEIGLAGHWMKHLLHHMFIYKAKGKPGWQIIPE